MEKWDLMEILKQRIIAKGGPVNCHSHFDKAYVVTEETLNMSLADMESKWGLWKDIKAKYTVENLKARMRISADSMVNQGCKYCRTSVDVDNSAQLKCVQAILAIKEEYKDKLTIQVCSQVLEGALNKEAQKWIEEAAPMVDVLGGLPSRERPHQAEHLDYIFKIAKKYNKPVDVHIDQNNDPDEKDTELLAEKVIEHGLEGKVNAVHASSLASQKDGYMFKVIKMIKESGMSVIICPRSMLDQVDLRDKMAPVHNKVAPLQQLIEAGINVSLGVDNVHDYFCPFIDGDLYHELNFLLEGCRYYDMEQLVNIATVNGLKALGIK